MFPIIDVKQISRRVLGKRLGEVDRKRVMDGYGIFESIIKLIYNRNFRFNCIQIIQINLLVIARQILCIQSCTSFLANVFSFTYDFQ